MTTSAILDFKCMLDHQTKDLKLKQCSSPPPSPKQKKNESEIPNIMLNDNKNSIHFTSSFKYLGAFLMPDLTEDAEIEARINKATSQLGILKHFFNCKEVDRGIKYWVYLTTPLNTLLWGTKSWNLTKYNQK